VKTNRLRTSCALAVVGLAAAVGVWFAVRDGDVEPEPAGKVLHAFKTKGAKAKEASKGKVRERKGKARIAAPASVRPNLRLEAAEEAKMTAQMLEIYRALQDALDKDDRKQVFSLVHRLQAMDEWPDGIPASVKKRALNALAWFGAAGVSEAIGFLADSSQEIRDAAIDTFQQQLADNWDLGDKALGQTLVAMAKVVTDADALESFYDQLNNMRPSVRASTVLEIYASGNDSAKVVLDKNLESVFSTDDTTVQTRDDVSKALEAAQTAEKDPDKKEEYDMMYGPTKWDW